MKNQFERLDAEVSDMIQRLESLKSELNETDKGMAASELEDAAKHLDTALAFLRED